jgi:alkanesulfonate monooxygenase SsuD/methylene tetrahydromethanopterin reductase-like flavin-dependent oxidoreductase (luciferase family)
VRIERLEESLRVLTGLLGGAAFSFTGEHYAIDNLTSFPAPARRPPLLVGGGGKRMLGVAARAADIVSVMGSSVASGVLVSNAADQAPERIAEKLGWVREAAGDRFPELELSMVASVVVADDRRAAAARFAAARAWAGIDADAVLAMPTVLIGPVARIAEDLERRRERFGFSYVAIGDGDLAAFAPVVARLAGR